MKFRKRQDEGREREIGIPSFNRNQTRHVNEKEKQHMNLSIHICIAKKNIIKEINANDNIRFMNSEYCR